LDQGVRDMPEPVIDHIQITVKDIGAAEAFYDKLLPLLGFDLRNKGGAVIQQHEFHVVEYVHPRLAFAITSPRRAFADVAVHRRRPGAVHHIAFRVGTRSEVDGLHADLRKIGARIVCPPREFPEYTPPGYYALFFKDLDGIKYEILCHAHIGM
jgi:catechol 2,3-dioxygenase-like lactoylglutathione lyase family enzyme